MNKNVHNIRNRKKKRQSQENGHPYNEILLSTENRAELHRTTRMTHRHNEDQKKTDMTE